MEVTAKVLFALLAWSAVFGGASAALCESYLTADECAGKVVDTGNCIWQEGNSLCVSDGAGPGDDMVAVTSVEGPASDGDAQFPLPMDSAFCTLQPEVGKCRGAFPSFFFNSTAGECQGFLYGGCDGNANRFETLESCQSTSTKYCSSARSASTVAILLVAVVAMLFSM
jgi:hypothetical protein